jgi:hypothetical protein
VPLLCLLLALALPPTLIHTYAGAVATDGRRTAAIANELAGYTSMPSRRQAAWGKRRFDSDDWMERRYRTANDEVLLTVIRSYDLKKLYHHPELAVADAGGASFEPAQVKRFRQHPDIPVHVLHAAPGGNPALGLYVLHYDDRFVEDPIWFQLRTAGELLFSVRKPMTLFFAHDVNAPDDADPESLPASSLLFAAIDDFVGDRGGASR